MNLRLAAVLAAATLAGTSTGASAAPVCRTITYGDDALFTICVDVEPNQDRGTVAPTVTVSCAVPRFVADPSVCESRTVSVDRTGFNPNRDPGSAVEVDTATGSVRIGRGAIGFLYVNGTQFPVPAEPLCIGDPVFCG